MKHSHLRRGIVVSAVAFPALAGATREPVFGNCQGCELVFSGLPDRLRSEANMAVGEVGEPMQISGTVFDSAGKPRAGVIVYAYHTNAAGAYVGAHPDMRHGRLRAWVASGARGEYTFHTIRPGAYPGNQTPQHVHMHVLEPGCGTYYIDDLLFTDDPLLTEALKRSMVRGRAGSGLVTPERVDGVWRARREIYLGREIAGYPGCGVPN
jgi:protocatechuate 3,4-dioxygenase beta subunit